MQVGASNELPESEELDALYDRFLIRRQVNQVSLAGLPALLSGSSSNVSDSGSNGAEPGSAESIALSEEEMTTIRCTASACASAEAHSLKTCVKCSASCGHVRLLLP